MPGGVGDVPGVAAGAVGAPRDQGAYAVVAVAAADHVRQNRRANGACWVFQRQANVGDRHLRQTRGEITSDDSERDGAGFGESGASAVDTEGAPESGSGRAAALRGGMGTDRASMPRAPGTGRGRGSAVAAAVAVVLDACQTAEESVPSGVAKDHSRRRAVVPDGVERCPTRRCRAT